MSIVLDGVNQYAALDLITSVSSGQDHSFFCWVKSTQTLSYSPFFGLHGNGASYKMIAIRRDDDDFIDGRYRPSIIEVKATSTQKVTGVFKKCLAVWDESSGSMTVYVDGDAPVTASGSPNDGTLRLLTIGCQFGAVSGGTPNAFLGGSIAHAAYWKGVALTGVDVTDLMAGTKKPDELTVAPTHYKPLVNDQTGGIGADYTLYNSPTINSEDPYATGPSITNIDTDNEVTPGQAAVINVTEGGGTFTTATLGGSACTFTGTATATTRPVIIPTDLPYGTHELLVDGTISLAGVTLSPTADKQVLTVAGVDLSSNSLFYNSSPAVANGDQWELPTLTDQGKAIVADASGTVTVTGAGQQVQTFTHRVYDMDVGAWSNMPTATITPSGEPPEPSVEKPNLELIGSSTVFVELNATYTDQGALFTDNKDATRTVYSVVVVDTSVVGTTTQPYDADDTDTNAADTVYRSVVVFDPNDVVSGQPILRSIWSPVI